MSKSNNTGRPIEAVVVPTMSEAVMLIDDIRNSGKVFRVDFKKRTTGTRRTMVCRCGVQSEKNGGGKKYNFSKKGLISVYEFGKGYRTIPIDNIEGIKHKAIYYVLDTPATPGVYGTKAVVTNKKGTVPSITSPMYD
jgi:hypothetical protein